MPRITIIGLTVLLILFAAVPLPATAQTASPVTFGETQFQNHYPRELIFQVRARSANSDIVRASLHYKIDDDPSFTEVPLTITPGRVLDLSYTWNTEKLAIPPGAPVHYYWDVTDADERPFRNEEQVFRYDDVTYDWQKLENEDLAVWWHARPAEFGQQVFDVATRAFDRLRQSFKTTLDFPIRIIIYNSFEEIKAWDQYASEIYGGYAFPMMGLTVQIVQESSLQTEWLDEVIPHEITHLYFYQATHHPLSNPPSWLDEGLAQYHEFTDHSADLVVARRIVQHRGLIPLRALSGGFGQAEEYKVLLSYAESLSTVTYLYETYGAQGVADLLAAFRKGKATDAALKAALGRDLEGFQRDWLDWLDVPADMYPAPTPFPTLEPLPTAYFGSPPTQRPASSTPIFTVQPTVTPLQVAQAITPQSALNTADTEAPLPAWPIAALGLIVLSATTAIILFRKKRT